MSRVLIIGSHTQVSHEIGDIVAAAALPMEYAAGHADALQKLRSRSFGVVITSADSAIEEDLALLAEMRSIRPGVKCIVLAHQSTPVEVIAALRARVFACFTPPFDTYEIANLARRAASDNQWRDDLQVLSARPGWVSVRVNCRVVTAERLLSFAREFSAQLPEDTRQELMQALREILLQLAAVSLVNFSKFRRRLAGGAQRRIAAMPFRRLEVPVDRMIDTGRQVRLRVVLQIADPGALELADALGHGDQDGPLVGEVAVDRANCQASPLRQEIGVESIDTKFFEQVSADEKQPVQRCLAARLLRTGTTSEVWGGHG